MSAERFHLRAAVYLILLRDDDVLLARRFRTGWEDGKYSMIAGHLDGGETVTTAMIREAYEEGGLVIQPRYLKVVHTMHRKAGGHIEYIDFFAHAEKWEGEPTIKEPDKCDDIGWFPRNALPSNVLPHVRAAIDFHRNGVAFSECDWDSIDAG